MTPALCLVSRKLAADLPYSKHIHSKLVCHITHDLMNEHNPPMVLPNGMVYSLKVNLLHFRNLETNA